ncbi:MAG TPA: hypothetical protein VJZ27_04570, partial [Aggregatilineales bacterium]|nr:hypothetical protein [Aggregatilineales bacterium]
MIYLGRCAGILSGMCTGLDPDFDPWKEMQPYVAALLETGSRNEQNQKGRLWDDLRGWFTAENLMALMNADNLDIVLRIGQDYAIRAAQLPILADEILRKADRGELQTRLRMDDDLQKRIANIERNNARLVYGMIFGALAISGAILWASDSVILAGGALVMAGFTWLRLMWG